MQKTQEVKEIVLSDLILAAYLLAKGFELSKPPFVKDKLTYFTFKRTPEIEKVYLGYINNTAQVDPVDMVQNYNTIKAIAWDMRKAEKMNKGVSRDE